MKGIRDIQSFGKVEAESDTVLDYFVGMNITANIGDKDTFLVRGRKGSGKTALFRYFTESEDANFSVGLNLNEYPWRIHAKMKDDGVEAVESYVVSWKYLIAVEFAKLAVSLTDRLQMTEVYELKKFLKMNYGSEQPGIKNLFSPSTLKISGELEPVFLGNKLGKISFHNHQDGVRLGSELSALTEKILEHVKKIADVSEIGSMYLHFDELDRGITTLEESRKQLITGLILASKSVNNDFNYTGRQFKSIVYLREDIWDELRFSDKNKISESNSDLIEWNHEQLLNLIEKRIKVILGDEYSWEHIDDGKKINRQPKWKHIADRTLMRPRDMISFMNTLLDVAKNKNGEKLLFDNKDVVGARPKYSKYLKNELDDEISPHWPDWEMCLRVLSGLGMIYFDRADFIDAFNKIENDVKHKYTDLQALEQLYNFGVIEYDSRSGYGGSGWKSKIANPELGWDSNAVRFKVHLGLKEFLKLKEERS